MVLLELHSSVKAIHFYIEIGSMTILLQFLFAFIVAGIIILKAYFARIKSFLGSLRSKYKKGKKQ